MEIQESESSERCVGGRGQSRAPNPGASVLVSASYSLCWFAGAAEGRAWLGEGSRTARPWRRGRRTAGDEAGCLVCVRRRYHLREAGQAWAHCTLAPHRSRTQRG